MATRMCNHRKRDYRHRAIRQIGRKLNGVNNQVLQSLQGTAHIKSTEEDVIHVATIAGSCHNIMVQAQQVPKCRIFPLIHKQNKKEAEYM